MLLMWMGIELPIQSALLFLSELHKVGQKGPLMKTESTYALEPLTRYWNPIITAEMGPVFIYSE